jgi:hypothetical protein
MPNSEQIRYFWLKWIDRQFAKADPSHVRMRVETSRVGESSANKTIDGPVIASDGEAIQTKPELETPALFRRAHNDG